MAQQILTNTWAQVDTAVDNVQLLLGAGLGGATLNSPTIAGTLTAAIANFSGKVAVDDVTEATTTLLAALQTDGGLAVVKTIIAGIGIKLGGNAAANLLDDFEVGAIVTTLTTSGGSVTIDTGQDDLTFVKIGPLVIIFGSIAITSVSSPAGALRMTGLPFTVTNSNSSLSNGSARCVGFTTSLDTQVYVDPEINTTTALFTNMVAGSQGNIAVFTQASATMAIFMAYHTDA